MPAHGEYEFLPDEELIKKCLSRDMLAWEALISQSGVNMQSIHALLPDGHLHFEAAAIRRGTGKMVVVLYDMYRKENIGAKEVEVEVR